MGNEKTLYAEIEQTYNLRKRIEELERTCHRLEDELVWARELESRHEPKSEDAG